MTPVALTIAGSDSGGGAGIQADLKTFAALGVYGTSAITALTAQNTLGVQGVFDVPADFVRRQLTSIFDDFEVGAVKIGMISRPDTIEVVADELARRRAPAIVLDPVMVATSGDRLTSDEAMRALRTVLFPLARLITPNIPEAAALLRSKPAETEAAMEEQARELLEFGPAAVLVKGGHGTGPESVDLLVDGHGTHRFAAPRHRTRHTHGTGCTLSAAIAALLVSGKDLCSAVEGAKRFVTNAIAAADSLDVGHGAGPLHHFHTRRV